MRRSWMALAGFVIGVLATLWLGPRRAREVRIAESVAERELDRPIAKIDLNDVSFERALEEVRRASRLPIDLDQKGIAASGFDRSTAITLHGEGVPLGEILRRLLSAPYGPWLDYFVSNGHIIITAPWTATNHSFVRAYDVGRLLRSDPVLLSAMGTAQPPPANQLVSFLTDGVSERPGSTTWIGVVGNRLIVCQTWEGHRQVRELLSRFNAQTAEVSTATGPPLHWDQLSHSWISSGDAARIDEALRRPIPRIHFDGEAIETVMKDLSKLSGIPIVVDLDSRGQGYPFDGRVSVDLHDAPLWVALSRLEAPHPNGWELTWWVDNGVVVYSYQYRHVAHLVDRVYDVSDLGAQGRDVSALLAAAVVSDKSSRGEPLAAVIPGQPDRLIVRADWATQEAFASLLASIRAKPPATQAAAR